MTIATMTYDAYIAECRRLYGRSWSDSGQERAEEGYDAGESPKDVVYVLNYQHQCRKADSRNMAGR